MVNSKERRGGHTLAVDRDAWDAPVAITGWPGRPPPGGNGAAVPEVEGNRWSNGLAGARPLPTIDHRKTLCTVAQSPQREVSLHRRRRTALVLSAAIVAAAPLLAACGSAAHPGAAAVVGRQRTTVAQLQNRVNEVREAQRSAVADETQYEQVVAQTGTLTRDTLHRMVLDRVLDRAAENAGIDVTRREIQQLRTELEQQTGGAKEPENTWLHQYGVPPQHLDENLHRQLEAQKLAARLQTDTSQPAFWKALSDASAELNIDLNPRYGAWDAQKTGRVDGKTPWLREVPAAG
jgi:outer membrane murein-binding lipoprotein Lpp